MRQVEPMQRPRAKDAPHRAIGKRPALIADGLQQERPVGSTSW
jgi:hypothetical protein